MGLQPWLNLLLKVLLVSRIWEDLASNQQLDPGALRSIHCMMQPFFGTDARQAQSEFSLSQARRKRIHVDAVVDEGQSTCTLSLGFRHTDRFDIPEAFE
jgi:hypothetical protein